MKDDADEPLEETQGGFVGAGAENLTPIKLSFGPLLAQLPGKLKLSATKGGDKIRIWKDAQRTTAVPLPKVWQNGVQIPPTLYVEGVAPSAVAIQSTHQFHQGMARMSSPIPPQTPVCSQ